MKLRKNINRLLAIVLALNLSLSLVNVTALAAEEEAGDGRTLICKMEEHTHSSTCYSEPVLGCGKEAGEGGHTHTEECYDKTGEPICGQEESTGHVHDDSCYEEKATLTCGQEEGTGGHAHTEDCYTVAESVLTCGQEETAGHTHSDDCLDEDGNLICGQEETEPHSHDASCYAEGERTLTCGHEEGEGAHKHTEGCYTTESVLNCGKTEGEGAHTHTNECYPRICEQEETLGHVHTTECYVTCGKEISDEHPEHTEACHQPICGKEISDDHPAHTEDCYKQLTCGKEEHTHTDECYAPKTNDGESIPSADATDIQGLLKNVKITDSEGNDINGKLTIGNNYKIALAFSEGGAQGTQFPSGGTLTYQLPEFFKVVPKEENLTITINGKDIQIGTYSVSASGQLTIALSEVGVEKLKEADNVTLNFDMEATAQANPGSTGGSVNFGGAGQNFTFEVVDQPQVSVKKDGEYKENETHTGGTLSYTVKVTVKYGELHDAMLEDVLTPPQNSAFSLSDPKNVTVTLKRGGEEHTLGTGDYELTATEGDSNNPQDKAFQVKISEASAYAPLKEGDELYFTYTYEAGVSNSSLRLWANMENVATFTGSMPVEDRQPRGFCDPQRSRRGEQGPGIQRGHQDPALHLLHGGTRRRVGTPLYLRRYVCAVQRREVVSPGVRRQPGQEPDGQRRGHGRRLVQRKHERRR